MNVSTSLLNRLYRQTLQNGTKHSHRTPVPVAVALTRSMNSLGDRHIPTALDKKVLVWTKMYKSIEEIPRDVSYTTMRKSRDLMRIRVNVGMAVATVIGCIVVISYSKSKVGSGDSLQNRGLKFEADMKIKGEQERRASGSST